jgi:hypothetical protein
MSRKIRLLCGALAVFALSALAVPAQAGWGGVRVGIGIGFPIYPGPYYYRPYPYYYPAPVVVAPPPVVVAPAPAYPVPAPAVAPALAPVPSVSRAQAPSQRSADIERFTQQLQNPDPNERAQAATQLGQLKAVDAIGQLGAALSNDRSPAVRDAAARALGVIGSQEALAALQRAAQADEDRDVRRSASFAAEIIRASLNRP